MRIDRKRILKWVFLLFPVAVVVFIALLDWDAVKGIGKAFYSLNLFFVALGMLSMVVFWMLDGYILKTITAAMHPHSYYLDYFKAAIIGQYYSAITPMATGGQPFQVVYMKKFGIPVGVSTSAVTVKFLTFQVGVSVFYLLSLLVGFNFFYTRYNGAFWLSLIGFFVNAGIIGILFLAMVKLGFVERRAEKLIGFLHRRRLLKDKEKWLASTYKTLEDFQKSIVFFKGRPLKILAIIGLNVFHLLFLFSVGYFVCLSFGLYETPILDMIILQSFLYITVSFFPLPGGSGANEAGFYLLFQSFFAKEYIYLGMILWRIITYYFTLVVGVLFTVIEGLLEKKEKNAG